MDPQNPNQPAPPQGDSVVLAAWEGLKNTVTRERLKPTELERAVNIDIDDAGQIHRRRGFAKVADGEYHSLFTNMLGRMYVVKNGVLGRLYPIYAFDPLLPGVGEDYLDYVQVADDIYFASATVSGVIGASDIISRWGEEVSPGQWLSPVVNPTMTLGEVRGKLLGKPPMATALTYFNGRIYLAHDTTLWATELYLYHLVDKTRNFLQFEAPITMLATVTDGIYVGTTEAVYFLGGTFREMKRIPVMSVGAVPRSAVAVPSELIKPQLQQDQQSPTKNAVLFLTSAGLCAGFDNGVTYNLTQTDVLFPDAVSAAPLFRRQDGVNQYIGVLDSAGSPSANTRIGDYVDAEIRRFQGA